VPNECASCSGTFDGIKSEEQSKQACMQVGRLAGHCWKCKIFLSEGMDTYSPIYLLLQKFHVFSSEEYKMFYPVKMRLGYLVANTRWNYMNVDCFLI
jgi:hypothetical protein